MDDAQQGREARRLLSEVGLQSDVSSPHQYVLRLRLREAALRLAADPDPIKIVEIAFDAGFGDVSNFNRAFRAEFGMSPRRYRQRSD